MSVPENLTRTSSGGTIALTIEEGKTMVSEAQNRAAFKYRKAHERQYSFVLIDSTRPKMIKYLDDMTDKRAYIRHLIAMDMKSKGIETDGLDGEMEDNNDES